MSAEAHVAHGAAAAPHEAAHELPNWITVLHHYFPDAAWSNFLHQWENIIFSLTAAALISITALRAAKKQNLVPKGMENFCEIFVEGIDAFVKSILGKRGAEFVPFLGTLFIYILLMNWSGLIPFMKSATSSWSITIALALITTVYVHYIGIREQGFWHYLKHMAGNPSNIISVILIPLMFLINVTIEFIAVPLSLSLRLFANVYSEDSLIFKFAELNIMFKCVPFLFQIFANVLAIAFSVVQAFVFMLLSTVYIALLLPHEEHGHEEHSDSGSLSNAH